MSYEPPERPLDPPDVLDDNPIWRCCSCGKITELVRIDTPRWHHRWPDMNASACCHTAYYRDEMEDES